MDFIYALDGVSTASDKVKVAFHNEQGDIEFTAAALHVHGNTVKYRIRRLQELTGRPLLDPSSGAAVERAAHWWWALRRWLARARS